MKSPIADLDTVLTKARAAEEGGDWDDALSMYETALAECRALGGAPVAELLRKIGLVHYYRGDFDKAGTLFRQSKEVAADTGLTDQLAAVQNCLGIVHQALGQLDLAEELYLEAQQLAEKAGNRHLAVMIDQNLGTISSIRGDTTAALDRYQSALTRYRALNDDIGAARALNNIAMAHVDLKQYALAEESFNAALMAAEVRRDAETLGTVQLNRADLYLKQDRFDDARACLDQAFEIFGRLGSTSGIGETYKAYGVLYRQSGKLHLAEAHLSLVAELAQQADHPLLEAEAERESALVHLEQGRKTDALKSLNRAHRLFEDLTARRELVDIDRQLDLLEKSYLLVVQAWGESIESQDHYTAGHCARVADYTTRLASAVGFAGRDLNWIRMGAFLHDVGKARLPQGIIQKPSGFDNREWEEMRAHTTVGDQIVAELDFPYDLRPMVRSHHERWDGAGYPDGLSGEDIPLIARILCIADVFDALTTDRSYRSAFSQEEALAIMEGEAGKMIDPGLFVVFKAVIIEGKSITSPAQTLKYAGNEKAK
ncbi:MAG TPA: tetratricopeptide repeat protein [Longimicrobiales bacterium]